MNLPKEIKVFENENFPNDYIAEFEFHTGLKEAARRGLKQGMNCFKEGIYNVSCGTVDFRVTKEEYPSVKRRIV